jgi:hypothetical protein
MTKILSEISNGDIKKGLEPLLNNARASPSKFAVRQAFINVLKANEVPLSKEEAYNIYVGDNQDIYSKRIDAIMTEHGYTLSGYTYDKKEF